MKTEQEWADIALNTFVGLAIVYIIMLCVLAYKVITHENVCREYEEVMIKDVPFKCLREKIRYGLS